MNEASKILPRVEAHLLNRTVVDLGCGPWKVVPWAVGVDDGREHSGVPKGVDIVADISSEEILKQALEGRTFEVVFSSHALEHMPQPPLETLRTWWKLVKPEGLLILYLPDERFYVYDVSNPKARNPAHHHYLTADTFIWYLDQIPELIVREFAYDLGPDRYSFLTVARKKP